MFPELESKEETRNICHSYMLDHQHEEQLFEDIRLVFVDYVIN